MKKAEGQGAGRKTRIKGRQSRAVKRGQKNRGFEETKTAEGRFSGGPVRSGVEADPGLTWGNGEEQWQVK